MTALIIISAVVFIILIVLISFFSLDISYDNALLIKAAVGLFRFRIYPARQKTQMMSARKYKKLRMNGRSMTKPPLHSGKTEKLDISEFFSIMKVILERLDRYLGYIHTNIKNFDITVGGDNAASAALKYGAVLQSVSLFCELLDEKTILSTDTGDKISVKCSFLDDDTKFECQICMKIRIWNLLRIVIEMLMTRAKFDTDNKNERV